MTPQHFVGQTSVLEAPRGWDHEADGECGGLPVCIEHIGEQLTFTSVWKPSAEQLAVLLAGGGVAVQAFGGQPPLIVDVMAAEALLVPA